MNDIENKKIYKTLLLPNGDRIVLFDVFGKSKLLPPSEFQHNVARVDSKCKIIWIIEADHIFKYSTYMNICFDNEGHFKAISSDGVDYGIDIETGKIISKEFTK